MREIVFVLFSLFTICTAAGVVLSRNAIYSAFNLVMSFFGLAALYLLWGASFISMVQILVYAGAIVVLFVFVVMMLNLEKPGDLSHGWMIIGIMGVASWVFSLFLLRVLSSGSFMLGIGSPLTLKTVAKLLFTQYLWPFEVLTVFLLALIVGIYLVARPDSAAGNAEGAA